MDRNEDIDLLGEPSLMLTKQSRLFFYVAAAANVLLLAAHCWIIFGMPGADLRSLWSSVGGIAIGSLAVAALVWASTCNHKRYSENSRLLTQFWLLAAGSQACTVIGDTIWMIFKYRLGVDPFPSLADVFYLTSYPLMLIAVLRMPVKNQTKEIWVKTVLDVLIVMCCAVLAYWNFLLAPMLNAGSGEPLLNQVLSLAYPVGDLLLIWALLVALYRIAGQLRTGPFWLLVASVGFTIVADTVYAYQVMLEVYQDGMPGDLIYSAGYFFFTAAGLLVVRNLHHDGDRARRQEESNLYTWQIYLPYGWVLGAFVIVLARSFRPLDGTMPVILLAFGGIVALMIFRQVLALLENRHLYQDLRRAHQQVRDQAAALERANVEMQMEIVERRKIEAQLSHDALHDALTGLPNRILFLDRIDQAARKHQRQPDFHYAVLFIDVDSFKVVNDSLGHAAGDELLMLIARKLTESLRATDTVARLGGDEFVLLLEEPGTTEDVILTANRLQSAFSQPVDVMNNRLYVTTSIGIVMHAERYQRAQEALLDADLAMYQAKVHGKARYEIFEASMRERMLDRLALENDVRRALENKEFLLYYQPIFSLIDHGLVGFEALVRWQHPQRGFVEPGQFIPLAEETGMILPLGSWILWEACRQAAAWRAQQQENGEIDYPLKVSVNVSGKQIQDSGFVQEVARVLQGTGLPGDCLALEVTESVCLTSMSALVRTLEALQVLGVEIQIDDFGTGYSSLSYLQKLPVQSIKIDKTFVHAIQAGEKSPEILRAIMSIANDLGIHVVAEGIESEIQARALTDLHCEFAQGYWLARPMEAQRAGQWVSGRRKVY